MEEKEYTSRYYGKSLCGDCIHNFFNNGEGEIGCRAFPKGIPEEAHYGFNHRILLKGQVGEYVFTEAKFEDLSPIGQYFWKIRHKKR